MDMHNKYTTQESIVNARTLALKLPDKIQLRTVPRIINASDTQEIAKEAILSLQDLLFWDCRTTLNTTEFKNEDKIKDIDKNQNPGLNTKKIKLEFISP